jgi:hypothetical protein
MSVVRCSQCSKQVDSDEDLECFTENDEVLCESCRDEQEEEV